MFSGKVHIRIKSDLQNEYYIVNILWPVNLILPGTGYMFTYFYITLLFCVHNPYT